MSRERTVQINCVRPDFPLYKPTLSQMTFLRMSHHHHVASVRMGGGPNGPKGKPEPCSLAESATATKQIPFRRHWPTGTPTPGLGKNAAETQPPRHCHRA